MAKTTAPKSPAKSSAASKSKSKRAPAQKPAVSGAQSTTVSMTFPTATGAFTIEQPPDPGPKRERFTFAKIPHVLEVPNLIELQKAS
ncbi:MAG TPA: hypothetical protein VGN11_03445, partial [Candidatus Baltobacteraceae bacterium]|nr:hypothetical protein [Candidatus Baltobacteraceae bacterium]